MSNDETRSNEGKEQQGPGPTEQGDATTNHNNTHDDVEGGQNNNRGKDLARGDEPAQQRLDGSNGRVRVPYAGGDDDDNNNGEDDEDVEMKEEAKEKDDTSKVDVPEQQRRTTKRRMRDFFMAGNVVNEEQAAMMSEIKDFKMTPEREVPNYENQTPIIVYVLGSVVQGYLMFNAIITIMGITFSFHRTVYHEQSDSASFVEESFVAIYSPLIFFLLYFPLANTAFSEVMYYKFLAHGALVDFPDTGTPLYWYRDVRPMMFLFVFLLYVGYLLYYFGNYGAVWTTYMTFFSNLVVGIFLTWFRMQSIEYRLVSLSDYVQSFQGDEGEYGDIDKVSMTRALRTLNKITRLECVFPSYDRFMMSRFFAQSEFTKKAEGGGMGCLHHRARRRFVRSCAFVPLGDGGRREARLPRDGQPLHRVLRGTHTVPAQLDERSV
eukprot:PhM_4_TR12300/c1_g1_i1/m.76786